MPYPNVATRRRGDDELAQTGYQMPAGQLPVSRMDDGGGAPQMSQPVSRSAGPEQRGGPFQGFYDRARNGQPGQNAGYNPNQSGYDPNGPRGQMTYDGQGDLGANNGFNRGNMWQMTYDQIRRGQGDQNMWRDRADASRSRSDATRDSYQMPTYTQGPAFSFGAWGGQQPGIPDDQAIADTFRGYQSLIGQTGSGGGPVNARDAVASSTGGFGDAFYNYANAGANMLQTRMKDTHRGLTDNAAARGRLNTGFFDEDTGQLWRQLGSEAQDQINSKALDAARLDMEPAMQNARLATDVSQGNADRDLKARMYSRDADTSDSQWLLNFAAGRNDTRFGQGRDIYESDRDQYNTDRTFARRAYEDDRNFGRGIFEDDRNFGRGAYESDRGFDEDRYRFDEGGYNNARDYYSDMVAGARDWREGAAQQAKAEGGGFWSDLGGTVLGGVAGAFGGPLGAAAGRWAGGKIFNGGGGGGAGGAASAASRYAFPSADLSSGYRNNFYDPTKYGLPGRP